MQRRGARSGWGKKILLLFLACLSLPYVGAKKETDYYKILGLPKNCSERDVTRAYRKQALKWHPDKNRDDAKKAEQRFKDISEAYEVLQDAEKRKMYDLYGKEGVFAAAGGGGGPRGNGGGSWSQGFSGSGGVPKFRSSQGPGGATFFTFGGDHNEGGTGGMDGSSFRGFTDPRELFEGLFGEGLSSMAGGSGRNGASNIFDSFFGASLFDDMSGGHNMGAGGRGTRKSRAARGPPVQKDFWCSLLELCEGCEKKMRVTEEVIDPRTGESRRVSHVYRISVEPGWKEGTRVTFPPTSEGLRSMSFVLRQKPHRYFNREGDCLVYECRLTEDQARKGVRINVPMLRKSDPPIEISTKGQEISDGKEMLLPGLGMPRRGVTKGTSGPFKIRFRLQQRSGKAFAG